MERDESLEKPHAVQAILAYQARLFKSLSLHIASLDAQEDTARSLGLHIRWQMRSLVRSKTSSTRAGEVR